MTRRKFRGGSELHPRRVAVKPSERVESATETEMRLETLLRKLQAWLPQQPEWVFLLAQDRTVRKNVSSAVARTLTRIPQYQPKREETPRVELKLPTPEKSSPIWSPIDNPSGESGR